MDGYENTFRKFDENGGKFTFTWNWPAFVFGLIWYLVKGMWAKALIYLLIILVFAFPTGGVGAFLVWAAFGVLGNYDLYLLKRHGAQLWDQARFSAESVVPAATVTSNSSGGYESKLRALRELKEQQLISEDEYRGKRDELVKRAENADRIAQLEQARRMEVISEEEYQEKLNSVLA